MADGLQDLPELLAAAWQRRRALHDDPELTAYRVFHGHGEGWPGLTLERLGDVYRMRCVALDPQVVPLVEAFLVEQTGPEIWIGVVPEREGESMIWVRDPGPRGPVVAREAGLSFGFEVEARGNPGLYFDARAARSWVREHAEGRRLLNLFAWTGGFGVAGLAGGGRSVIHVEQQKRARERAKRNHELNNQGIDDRDLSGEDVYRFLRQAAKRGRRFGGIIIDAPPQVPPRGPHRPEGQDYETLVPLALDVLEPDGWILCSFSRRDVSRTENEARIRAACDGALEVIGRGSSGVDFPEADPEAKLRFSAWARA
ncbi:MAG: class I SAM-dependent methyltransferase [Planctomycetota bacterium]|nr:class I SAM-dependent methyltransferase [Planctomycetota bacterium]